jgi:hypothetical protein
MSLEISHVNKLDTSMHYRWRLKYPWNLIVDDDKDKNGTTHMSFIVLSQSSSMNIFMK